MFVETFPELMALVDVQKLGGCIIAVDAWVPLYVDQTSLKRSDRFHELIANISQPGQWEIPEAMWQIRRAYRLSSQGQRKQLAAYCEAFFQADHPNNRFSDLYRACMAQVYGASLCRELNYNRIEEIYAGNPSDCDDSGFLLARKNLILGAMRLDLNELDKAEKLLRSCERVLRHRVGSDFFLWTNWHLKMAQCRLAQGRAEDAEQIVRPMMQKRLDSLNSGNTILSFSDWEVVEIFATTLRDQCRFDEALDLVEEALLKTNSPQPPLARSLGELTCLLIHLERLCSLVSRTSDKFGLSVAAIEFEATLQKAHLAYERAADAYEIEWTRGFWAFTYCPAQLKEIESRFGAELIAQLQCSTDEEVLASFGSLTDATCVELTDETSTGTIEAALNSLIETPTNSADTQPFSRKDSDWAHLSEYADKSNTREDGLSFPAVTKSKRARLVSRVRKRFE
ncbi:hypothetical protein LTS15_006269 [Exophiala xenobiotica]|nr:hypothetical protein LTS15_006269 [Exophiala xenobiotica]